MAKKTKELDFDWDVAVESIEKLNASGLLDEEIEIDEDDKDATIEAFLEAFMPLADTDIETIDDHQTILDFVNKELPDRFFPDSDEQKSDDEEETLPEDDPELGDDESEGVEPEDDPDKDSEPEEEEKPKSKKDEKPKKKFKPACPTFGEHNPDAEECTECKKDYAEEYAECLKLYQPEEKPKAKKAEKDSEKESKGKKAEKEEKPSKKETSKKVEKEEKPKEKPKKKAEVVEEEPAEEKKKSFRPKAGSKSEEPKEEKKSAKESTARRKAAAALTGRKVADFFRRVSTGGIFNECVLDCQKGNLIVNMTNAAQNVFAHFVSSFPIPHIGKIGIGDISKITKFCSSIGDSEVEIEVTDDRFVIRATGNKVQLLLADLKAIQTDPDETNVEEILEAVDATSVIAPDAAKDIRSDIKLIKNDKLAVEMEDGVLSIVGGEEASDKFKVKLRKPDIEAEDFSYGIHSGNFGNALGTMLTSDEPIELMFNSSEDVGLVLLRQGEDVVSFSTGDGEEEAE